MAKADKKVKAQVAKGRSVDIDGKLRGPGEIVELLVDEALDLRDKGFVVEPNADAVRPASTAVPKTPTTKGTDGSGGDGGNGGDTDGSTGDGGASGDGQQGGQPEQ